MNGTLPKTTSNKLTEIQEIRSQASAVEAYAVAKGSDELAQMAMEIKLRAERKAGQFIAYMKEQGQIKASRQKKGHKMLHFLN